MEFPNWFDGSEAKSNFDRFLTPMAGQPHLTFLQVGVYTGDATVWLMENVLTHKTCMLYDVDTWEGSDEIAHKTIHFKDVFDFYKQRTKKYLNVIPSKQKSLTYLRYDNRKYDFIYIDADHTAIGVLLDAELSWDLLKSGGILAFDDYQWSEGKGDALRPMPGINSFIDRHRQELDILHVGWQFWVKKK